MPAKLLSQLSKGTRVQLRNGWEAEMVTVKGNTPIAKVYGFSTETGSVYAHDVALYRDDAGLWQEVLHTPAQLKLRRTVAAMGM